MTGCVAEIWRHPIKAHGREALAHVDLIAGKTMPWDRTWAVAHSAAKTAGDSWVRCVNFSRGAKAPSLQAIEARLDEASGQITLNHPERPEITFLPEDSPQEFFDWVGPIMPSDRAQSVKIVRASDRGMTDSDFPSISLLNTASNEAVAKWLDAPLSMKRWRGNFSIDGLEPWEEFDWIGKEIRIGGAVIEVRERIGRCLATAANPDNGERDADTLGALKSGWNHTDFGVYGVVTQPGEVKIGDTIEVIE